jgi:hypothetical protein
MININGKIYQGNNISIVNGKVTIDGKDQTPDSKEINITVNGNIDTLKVDVANKVFVVGQVNSVSTVSGDVDTSGDVLGSISTVSGDVECGNVGGSITTVSGDIKHRR